jgi:hypothetical protein
MADTSARAREAVRAFLGDREAGLLTSPLLLSPLGRAVVAAQAARSSGARAALGQPGELARPGELAAPAPAPLFAVHTWFRTGFASTKAFWSTTLPVTAALKQWPEGLVGFALGNSIGYQGVTWETLTVWTDRKHMAAFFNGPVHREAMVTVKVVAGSDYLFGVRRLWLSLGELPQDESSAQGRALLSRVKSDAFARADLPTQTPTLTPTPPR